MTNSKLKYNPLKSKADVKQALVDLIKPLEAYFETSTYGLKYDSGGAHCRELTREVEALLRPLWGIVPLMAGGGDRTVFQVYLNKIKAGTDTKNPSYWGKISHRDQMMVEMASIGTGLCIAKAHIWDVLTETERENLYQWLEQINHYDMPPTNWLFFRILVNLGFKQCGLPYPEAQIEADLADIDSYYLDQGWYVDGYPDQIDYYIPFAFHFYGLIYVKVIDDDKDQYVCKFKERAVTFASSFRHFFTDDGVAVPYGRSLTYRFAQSAFWGALAFADVEALPWGEVKHLCLQNLRHWFGQSIFSANGELTIGYYYRNLVMAEGYNAYGSPYWALKSFIFLAIPDDHPFWQAEEKIGAAQNQLLIPEMRSILARDETGNQVQMFTMGQHCEGHAHVEAKYEKFVYSTAFGFSVSKSVLSLGQGAFDNTLAVSVDNGRYYRSRYGVESYDIKDEYLTSVWQPYPDTQITSYVIPLFPWHVRIHEIQTNRELTLADGGFTFDCGLGFQVQQDESSVCSIAPEMISSIQALIGKQSAEVVFTEPNTNIYFDRGGIPTLKSTVSSGHHLLVSAVLGAVGKTCEVFWDDVPTFENLEDAYVINYQERMIRIDKK